MATPRIEKVRCRPTTARGSDSSRLPPASVDLALPARRRAGRATPRRLPAHQRPAGCLEVRHDVAAAPLAVASLGRRPLIDSATIPIPAVADHVLVLADKFHVGKGAWFRT